MNIAARFNTLGCATVLVGLLTFCVADAKPGLAIVAGVVCFIGWLAGGGGGGWRPLAMPRALVNLLVLGAIINAAFRASSATVGQPIVSHLGEFLVYVQLLKLFDRRNSRDESQLLTLSIFVVIAAMLTSNTFPVGVCLIVYTPLMVATAMLYQLRAGQLRASAARTPAAAARASGDERLDATSAPPVVVYGRRAGVQFRRVAGVSLIAASALALALFVLTPRGLGQGSLGRFGEGRQGPASTGFTETIRLGGDGFLQDNATPVLDLTVEDVSGNNLGGPERTFYLRGVTRDNYEGPIWTSPTQQQFRRLATSGETRRLTRANEGTAGAQIVQRITLRKPGRQEPVFFTIWRPINITVEQTSELLIGVNDLSIRRNGNSPGDQSYVIQSSPTDFDGGREPEMPSAFATGPIRDLAVSILRENNIDPDPAMRDRAINRQAAAVLRDHLQERCAYSREMIAPAAGQDPIEMFLFDTKRGHCEYFASAMVALSQSVGLPARLVVGYVAADFNNVTGKYLVRQSNAHAWAEVHIGNGAWQTFDPSPSEDVTAIHRPRGGWLASLRHWYESIEFGWNRSIIGFDDRTQKESAVGKRIDFAAIERFFSDISGRLFVAARTLNRGEGPTIPWWVFPAAIGCAAIAVISSRRRWRAGTRRARAAKVARAAGTRIPEAEFYSRALADLARASIAKPESLPPLAHARQLTNGGVPVADAFRNIAGLFYKLRFAGRPLTPEEQARAAALADDLRAWARDRRRRRAR